VPYVELFNSSGNLYRRKTTNIMATIPLGEWPMGRNRIKAVIHVKYNRGGLNCCALFSSANFQETVSRSIFSLIEVTEK